MEKKKIILVSPGLGYINRGYETHMAELYKVMQENTDFDFYIFKRNGKTNTQERNFFSLKRNWNLTHFFRKLTGIKDSTMEQISFFLFIIPSIIKLKPHIIYVADYVLSVLLMKLKKALKLEYNIIFRNGNNYLPPYKNADYIQQLLPSEKWKNNNEENSKKQFTIPHGFHFENFISSYNKFKLRSHLNLPFDKTIILSVGKVDKTIKRMDYVINEMSVLNEDFFLLILGQYCNETAEIKSLAEALLGKNRFMIRTVDPNEINNYYHASDIFVSASLNEGFGRMYVEAAYVGLPMIVHDYQVPHKLLENYPIFSDLSVVGNLSSSINKVVKNNFATDNDVRESLFQRFDWKYLKIKYEMMFKRVLNQKC